jgi:hypothetical protein
LRPDSHVPLLVPCPPPFDSFSGFSPGTK